MFKVQQLQNLKKSTVGPGLFDATQRLWAVLYGFIFTPRTDEQLGKTMKKLAKCRCKVNNDRLSLRFHREYDDLGGCRPHGQPILNSRFASIGLKFSAPTFFIAQVFGTIHDVLKYEKHLSISSVRKGRSTKWPFQMSDVLPFGPDTLIESLLQWNRLLNHPCILGTAIPIFNICGARLHQSIAKYDVTNQFVLPRTKAFLDDSLKSLVTSSRKGVPVGHKHWEEAIVRMSTFYDYIGWIFGSVLGPDALFRGGEVKALQICSLCVYIYRVLENPLRTSKPDPSEGGLSIKMSALEAQEILHTFRLDKPGKFDIPLHPSIMHVYDDLFSDREDHPIQRIARAMVSSRVYECCMASGCRQTFAHVGSKFKYCDGCSTVGYCGPECQARDWKDPEIAHKDMCPILSKVLKVFGDGKWPDTFQGRSLNNMVMDSQIIVTHSALWQYIYCMYIGGELLTKEDGLYLKKWADRVIEHLHLEVPVEYGRTRQPGYDDYERTVRWLAGPSGFNMDEPCYMTFVQEPPGQKRLRTIVRAFPEEDN